jgi:acyl-CoA synthetase (NDP forming)
MLEQQLDSYLEAVAGRASRADVASLRHLLEPASMAVIGASRARGSAGREILHNIVTGGFAGTVHVVNASGEPIEGITSLRSAARLPASVDVAVVAVPAAEVAGVAAECGRRDVRALIVITAGFDATAGAELLAICRRYGMRLVGPNCFGIVNTGIGLNATFAEAPPLPGSAGIVVQSGGIGIALLEHIARLGIGVSSFASVGDKYDVSSNDLLTWWEQDGRTRMAVLYVESFGSPRGFARTARRLARQLPVLTVIGGRSAAGQRAAASQSAAPAIPLVTQEALFGQAGVVATHSLGELIEVAALLSCQPLPAGRRVAIVSSAGGVGVLAADACVDAGLSVAELSEDTQRRLAALLPPGAAVSGPVDTTASVTVADFRTCLEEVAADDAVDALLAIGVPTAMADLSAAILAADVAKPVAAALLDRSDSVSVLSAGAGAGAGADTDTGAGRRVPAYGYPESAARALGHAADYRDWRGQDHGQVPELSGVDTAAARELVSEFLAGQPAGGWLPGADAARLVRSYGIPLGAAPEGGGDVALKAGVVQEQVFGPLVVFGLGGVAAEVIGDRSARLAPLTDVDADQLIRSLRAAPLLLGQRDQPAVDLAGLASLLLRVSRLADDLPEVAELDLSPVIASPAGVHAVDVRVRLARAVPRDPFLRQLR